MEIERIWLALILVAGFIWLRGRILALAGNSNGARRTGLRCRDVTPGADAGWNRVHLPEEPDGGS
jgi:alkylated DNA nucleotide flippase Atl1